MNPIGQNADFRKLSRLPRWQALADFINTQNDLESLLSEKIIGFRVLDSLKVLEYQPSSDVGDTFLLSIDTQDLRSASMSALSEGVYELGVEKLFEALLPNSKKFIDIGANVGFYTCFAITLNNDIQVISIEPNEEVRKRLNFNIQLNKYENKVNVIPFGVALNTEVLEFYIPPNSGTGAGSLRDLHPEEGESQKISIEVKPLTSILEKSGEFDLLKMDIEGSELNALISGIELITKYKPVIIVELLRKWMKPFGNHPQDVINLLLPHGYTCYSINHLGIQKISKIDESTEETNFLFYPDDRSDEIITGLMRL